MKPDKVATHKENNSSFESEISELIKGQNLFTESIYSSLPIGIEIYDTQGILRNINDYALKMYGVDDRKTVENIVNLFNSPYCDDALKAKIQGGEDIVMEFEYDFDRINNDAYFHTHNKNTMIYEVKISAIRNKKGNIIGYILLASDVTTVKEAEFRTEEGKKNLEMAMDAANMSSWVYDVHKEIFNPLYGDPLIKNTITLEEFLVKVYPQDGIRIKQLFSQLINKEIQYGHTTIRYYNDQEKQYRNYETRMRLSSEHLGKLLIIGTELDVTEKIKITKKAQDLATKRELTMQASGIVHWDFDVHANVFESYNDPINDYASEKLVTVQQFTEVLHPEDYSVFNDFIQSMKSGKDIIHNFTCRIMTKYNKSWQYCNIVALPFERDKENNIIRYTGFRQDISKIHQLNEELRERNYKMELTFKTIGMSYWDFDVQNKQFKSFNDPTNDFNPEILISPEAYLSTIHPDDQNVAKEYINHMLNGLDKDFSFKFRSKTKWNKEWQSYIVTGIQSEKNKKGQVIRYTGIQFNNTQWEKVTQELKALKEKAELSDRLKSAFLANMSHEIRTPLNAIVGFSELLVNCDDTTEKEEYSNIIQSNNELLLRLINDILDLSKIESGILERKREKFNLSVVCRELYAMIQPKITTPGVEFILENSGPECWVYLDRNRLKQVWMNYLTNAVKCTRQGHIRMGYTIENGGIRIYVEDTGVGIPYELQNRVFGRFQKLNEFAQGTGLGLAICKAIIEGAGGEVGFTSTPGKGTTFWGWLPCTITTEENTSFVSPELIQPQSPQDKMNTQELKILIVEDNDSNYLLVQQILKNHRLVRVKNGVEAVIKVRDDKFDFILMDMKMPIMGGLEATRKIREFNTQIPIIALTANAFDSDKTSAIEAGCNAFLTKPLKKNELLEILSMK